MYVPSYVARARGPAAPISRLHRSLSPSSLPSCQELAYEYLEAQIREIMAGLKPILNNEALDPDYRLGATDQMLAALELLGGFAQATQERRDQLHEEEGEDDEYAAVRSEGADPASPLAAGPGDKSCFAEPPA